MSFVTSRWFDEAMSHDAVTIIREESERAVAALTAADPAQQVPTCPDWTADDLLWHLAEVHEFWAAILSSGATTEEEVRAIEEGTAPRPEGREGLLERRAAATDALLAQLTARADHEPAWFWYSQAQGVGATRRMQTHEASIHRVDAELTAAHPVTPIPAPLAADGLAHVLDVMWPARMEWLPDWAESSPVALVEIAPEDGSLQLLEISRWSATRPRDGEEVEGVFGRRPASDAASRDLPRARVTGSPLALDLWAWGRAQALEHLAGGAEKVSIQGDDAATAALQALIAEGHD